MNPAPFFYVSLESAFLCVPASSSMWWEIDYYYILGPHAHVQLRLEDIREKLSLDILQRQPQITESQPQIFQPWKLFAFND